MCLAGKSDRKLKSNPLYLALDTNSRYNIQQILCTWRMTAGSEWGGQNATRAAFMAAAELVLTPTAMTEFKEVEKSTSGTLRNTFYNQSVHEVLRQVQHTILPYVHRAYNA